MDNTTIIAPAAVLYCPHCKRPLESGHDCLKPSRRFFIGSLIALVGTALAVPDIPGIRKRLIAKACIPCSTNLRTAHKWGVAVVELPGLADDRLHHFMAVKPGVPAPRACKPGYDAVDFNTLGSPLNHDSLVYVGRHS